MLHHPTLDKLQALRLHGMYHALVEQMRMPDMTTLSFEERLGLLVDREASSRSARTAGSPLSYARPNCGRRPVSKTSTIASREDWTRP
jgi:hypothetical protein